VVVWSLVAFRSGVRFRAAALTLVRNIARRVRTEEKVSSDDASDNVRRKACELMELRRVRQGLLCFIIYGAISVLFLVRNLVQMHVAGIWSGDVDSEFLRSVVVNGLHVDLLFGCVCGILVWAVPKASGRLIDALHVIFYVLMMLHWWAFTDSLSLIWKNVTLTVVRVVSGIVFGNAWLVAWLNVLYSVCATVRVVTSDTLLQHASKILGFEFFVCLAICGVSVMHELALHMESLSHAQATASSRQERMAQQLLSLLCDAVVQLDGTLRVSRPSPALEALLLQQTAQGYCGTHFDQLLSVRDRDRFREFISGSDGRAQGIHLHLLDSTGAEVAVQLLHTPSEDLFGQMYHLVGIREDSDSDRLLRQPPPATVDQIAPGSLLQHNRDVGGSESSSRSDELVRLSSQSSTRNSECVACIDALSGNLRFLECSPSFTAIGGPILLNDGLLDWVVGEKETFVAWVQRGVNDLLSSEEVIPCEFHFAPPHLKPSIQITAVCELRDLEQQDSDNGSSDEARCNEVPVRIAFSHVREFDRRRRRRKVDVLPKIRRTRPFMHPARVHI